jgi:hypothetical protein
VVSSTAVSLSVVGFSSSSVGVIASSARISVIAADLNAASVTRLTSFREAAVTTV